MIDKRFIGKVPQNREGKREPSGDSVKNRRNQIEVLTREINDLREKIRLDRYKDVDIFSKVKEIEKRKKRLEFTLMSKEEQDALLLYIQELQNKVNVLSEEKDNDKDAYGIEGRKRFILALSELQREKNGLPEKVLKEFLDKNTEKNSIVLMYITAGNYIPAYAGNYVYIGHANTPGENDKEKIAERFYKGEMGKDEVEKFLRQERISSVFFGPQERSLGGLEDLERKYPFLQSIYQNKQVMIYKTF